MHGFADYPIRLEGLPIPNFKRIEAPGEAGWTTSQHLMKKWQVWTSIPMAPTQQIMRDLLAWLGSLNCRRCSLFFLNISTSFLAGDTFPSHFGVVDIAVNPSKTCGLSSSHPIRINKMGHRRLSKLILANIWRLFHTECQHNSHQFQQLHFHSLPIIPLHAVCILQILPPALLEYDLTHYHCMVCKQDLLY